MCLCVVFDNLQKVVQQPFREEPDGDFKREQRTTKPCFGFYTLCHHYPVGYFGLLVLRSWCFWVQKTGCARGFICWYSTNIFTMLINEIN